MDSDDDGGFGDFEAASKGSGLLQASATMEPPPLDSAPSTFGDFATSPPPLEPDNQANKKPAGTGSLEDAFGSFAASPPVEATPAGKLDNAFGSFTTSLPVDTKPLDTTDSLSDAFGSFAASPTVDATPAANLDDAFGSFAASPPADTNPTDSTASLGDAFGSFAASPPTEATPTAATASVDDAFGTFTTSPPVEASPAAALDNAFGTFAASPPVDSKPADTTASLGDAFGSFAASPPIDSQPADTAASLGDAFGTFAATQPVDAALTDASSALDDALGSFATSPPTDTTTPSFETVGALDPSTPSDAQPADALDALSSIAPSDTKPADTTTSLGDFGSFAASPSTEAKLGDSLISTNPPTDATSSLNDVLNASTPADANPLVSTASLDPAFESFAPNPLGETAPHSSAAGPDSLDALSGDTNLETQPESQLDTFTASPPVSNPTGSTIDSLGNIAPGQAMESSTSTNDNASGNATVNPIPVDPEAPLDDAFSAFAASPSVDAKPSETSSSGLDDAFGTFAANSQAESNSGGTSSLDDPFGAFTAPSSSTTDSAQSGGLGDADTFTSPPVVDVGLSSDSFGDVPKDSAQPKSQVFSPLSDADSDAVPFESMLSVDPASQGATQTIEGGGAPSGNPEDFGDFSSTTTVSNATTQDATFTDVAQDGGTNGTATNTLDFGDFNTEQSQGDGDWSAFGAPVESTGTLKNAEAPDWGDFGTTPAANNTIVPADDWGEFGSTSAPTTSDADDWGTFDAPTATDTPSDNTFGDFAATASTAPTDSGFGAFAATESQPSAGFTASDSMSVPTPVSTVDVKAKLQEQLAQMFPTMEDGGKEAWVASHPRPTSEFAAPDVWQRVEKLKGSTLLVWRGSKTEASFASTVGVDLNLITALVLGATDKPAFFVDAENDTPFDMVSAPMPTPSPHQEAQVKTESLDDALAGLATTSPDMGSFDLSMFSAPSGPPKTAVRRSTLEVDLDLFSPPEPSNVQTPDIAASLGILGEDLFSPNAALPPTSSAGLTEQAQRIIAQMPDLSFMVPAI